MRHVQFLTTPKCKLYYSIAISKICFAVYAIGFAKYAKTEITALSKNCNMLVLFVLLCSCYARVNFSYSLFFSLVINNRLWCECSKKFVYFDEKNQSIQFSKYYFRKYFCRTAELQNFFILLLTLLNLRNILTRDNIVL